MKPLSEIYKELGIAFRFPIIIKDARGNETYTEYSNRYYYRSEYDSNGNETYYEDSDGHKEGTPRSQSCDGKVIEVDGKKYMLKEL
jgi:hypothetical protein